QLCNNCLIQLLIPGGGTIQMNYQVVLTGGSFLTVGSGVNLKMIGTNATAFNDPTNPANYIILTGNGNNQIQWADNTATLTATNLGPYDGIFTSTQVNATDFVLLKEFGAAPVQFTNNTITNTGPSIFGTSLVGPNTLNGFGTLPILVSSFSATLNQDVVNLAWTTTLEENADHIAVERSSDAGAHWATLGTVPAKGNSGSATDYTFTDDRLIAGTLEYRLQLVDKDGKYKYSDVKVIRTSLITAANIYPNPAHDYVNVTLGGNSTETIAIRLFNQNGQLLQEKSVSNGGGTTVALSVGNYPQGNYLLVVTAADGTKQTSKLLISK
ncbi:MAG TPA: T9SS type A sorting domain-containing protein, partial [Puia sp.]|nr:T9SS type A sorting domain-containing protein [Puia sp.]